MFSFKCLNIGFHAGLYQMPTFFWQTLCPKNLNNQTDQWTSVYFLKFCMKMKQIKYKYKKIALMKCHTLYNIGRTFQNF